MGGISILMFEGSNNKKQYTISFNISKVNKLFKDIFNKIFEEFKNTKFDNNESFRDLLSKNTVQEKTLGSSRKYAGLIIKYGKIKFLECDKTFEIEDFIENVHPKFTENQ